MNLFKNYIKKFYFTLLSLKNRKVQMVIVTSYATTQCNPAFKFCALADDSFILSKMWICYVVAYKSA